MNLSQFRLHFALTAALAIASALTACVSSDDDPPADTSSTATTTTAAASTNTTTSGAGGSTSTSTATTATATTGAAGAGAGLDCTTTQVVAADSVIDFESYDGTAAAAEWEFNFNGDADGVGAVYAGLFPLTETTTTTYSLSFVAGAEGSSWALSAQNPATTDWGGGIGMWSGCMDASAHTGLQFMVRGSSPVGTGSDSMDTSGGANVSADFVMPTTEGEWTQVQLAFSAFEATTGEVTDGNGIGNFTFAAHMTYAPDSTGTYVPQPGAFELTIDNIGFY
jgi:hypothetical protein